MAIFRLDDRVRTMHGAAQALAVSSVYSEEMAQAVLCNFCHALAVALEVEGRDWTTEEGERLLQAHVEAGGVGEGLELWAAFLRVADGMRHGVPKILLRPLVLDVLLCSCRVAISGEVPRSFELVGGDNSPDFSDMVRKAWGD